jgi:hypothetical protein
MRVTAILRDFPESFFTGEIRYSDGSLSSVKGDGWDLLDAAGKWRVCLDKQAGYGDAKARIPLKVGDGSFRDRVELTQICREPHTTTCEVAPRRGYLLATFDFQKATK